MKRIQVTFTPEQHASLKRLSAERGVSMSQLVREAIELDVMPRYWRLLERRRREEQALREDGRAS